MAFADLGAGRAAEAYEPARKDGKTVNGQSTVSRIEWRLELAQEFPWGRFVYFAGPDGNRRAVQQIVPLAHGA